MMPFIFAGLVGAMIFVNIYFRLKVIRIYKALIQSGISVSPGQLLSRTKMENELISKYPRHRELLLDLRKQIIRSLALAATLWLVVLAIGLLVYLTRNQ